ncbi:PHP domain-containing protein [Amycolatopsis roodepoortensis]|uniref:Metal-dependent phosphoesterase TrpH n=1 Tax=Amycolatopsis roodepoortensis TaxID=700274 RepID=A0ABR9LHM3_9PSEU|nr:PHP domain-containing protein [Amycolatopsis roodepoortensis]MBE1580175.1 putative metal-dependent phosphoesterase TrpH [Amycolatopsis roodepoortensis]
MRIDLHAHSTASDGTDSPAGLVAAAAKAGLDVVAITDHDTTAGWAPAAEALPPGLTLVPGAELSTISVDPVTGRHISVHLLAYLFDPASPSVVAEQTRLRSERRWRLRVMAERMAADGLPVDPDEVMSLLPEDGSAGRPHLAQALVRAGVVSSVNEAFASYLGNGSGYFVARQDTLVEDAIDMIAEAGGVTVIAHPFAYTRGATITVDVLAGLAGRGLTGVEVDHPNHDEETRVQLHGLAGELGLVRTGSSDYHGTNKTIDLGDETTDPLALEELVARSTGYQVVTR